MCLLLLFRHESDPRGVVDANFNHAYHHPSASYETPPGPLVRTAQLRHKNKPNLLLQSIDPAVEITEVPIDDNIKYLDCLWFQRWFMPWQTVPKKWQLWFVCDCAGICAAVFTWLLIVFGEIALIMGVLIPFHNTPYAIFSGALNIFWAFLAFVAHVKTMFLDPVSKLISFLLIWLIYYNMGIKIVLRTLYCLIFGHFIDCKFETVFHLPPKKRLVFSHIFEMMKYPPSLIKLPKYPFLISSTVYLSKHCVRF